MAQSLNLVFDRKFDAFASCEAALKCAKAVGLADAPFRIPRRSAKVPAEKVAGLLRKADNQFFWLDGELISLRSTLLLGRGVGLYLEVRRRAMDSSGDGRCSRHSRSRPR